MDSMAGIDSLRAEKWYSLSRPAQDEKKIRRECCVLA